MVDFELTSEVPKKKTVHTVSTLNRKTGEIRTKRTNSMAKVREVIEKAPAADCDIATDAPIVSDKPEAREPKTLWLFGQ